MKAKRIREVREIIRSAEFEKWFARTSELRQSIRNVRERKNDLLIQANMVRFKADLTQQTADEALFHAGELEDRAARAHAEFSEIENDSFEVLSTFEAQRHRATRGWELLARLENLLEEKRQKASDLRARVEAVKKAGAGATILAEELRQLETSIEALAREVEDARSHQQQDDGRREQLWLEVEAAWSSSFRANMARTEHAYQARRQRTDAESLFARAAAERRRIEALEEEARRVGQRVADLETELDAVLEQGRRQLECCLIGEFLYWPNHDDVRAAWCVPLIEERNHFNIQVVAMRVYKVERARGLEFLEPVPETEGAEASDDSRLDMFFSAPNSNG